MGQAPLKLDNKQVQVALLVALESLFFLASAASGPGYL
jgi:hypothetical protein